MPRSQVGVTTSTFGAPKMSLAACCRIRLTPKVTSSVSSGRSTIRDSRVRSSSRPSAPATRNASGSATTNAVPLAPANSPTSVCST